MSDKHHVTPPDRAGFLTGRIRSLVHNPGKIMGSYICCGDTVVDLGCGPGFFTCPMAEMTGPGGKGYCSRPAGRYARDVKAEGGRKGTVAGD